MNSGPSTALANALENRPTSIQIGSLPGFESTQHIGPLPAVVEATREDPCDESVNLLSIDVCPRLGRIANVVWSMQVWIGLLCLSMDVQRRQCEVAPEI